MPDLLPDIPTEDWESYRSDVFKQDTDQRISSLPLSIAPLRDDWNQPGTFAPPASSDSLTDPIGTRYAQSAPQPEPQVDQPPDASTVPPEADTGQPAPTDFGTHADARIASLVPSSSASAASTSQAAAPASSPVPGGGQLPSDLITSALNAADQAGVDPGLMVSLIQQESNFNPRAQSPAGAQGLGQLMPATARALGVTDSFDPAQNLRATATYLKQNIDRFGGDVVKALAAYNAGPGAVEKYGGVPPYQETQRYVDSIMTRLADQQSGDTTPGVDESLTRVGADIGAAKTARDISQFGDPQLTTDEAYAACGPAASVRFAAHFGRNPTLREATDLAKQVGWSPAQGMAGIDSEATLMQKLGVPVKVVRGAQWDQFAQEAQTGNPVTISTAGHYFFADGYDPTTGKFHVGRSGLDLKAGAEWMSPDQMTAAMGAVQGGLLADNPQTPAPSTADQQDDPVAWLGRQKDAIASSIGGAVQGATSAASSFLPSPQDTTTAPVATTAGDGGQTPEQIAAQQPQPQPQQSVWDKIGQGISDVFKSAFGGNQTIAPEGGGYGAVPPGGINPVADAVNVVVPGGGGYGATPAGGTNPLESLPTDVIPEGGGYGVSGPLQPGEAASALAPVGQAVQQAAAPFGGASPQFPTGGPLAGPGVGIGRQVAGFEQLASDNPEYALLKAERDSLLAQQPANAAAAGGPDVVARAQRIRDIEARMRQIASQTDITAAAQRNPNIGGYEAQGALLQSAAATALAPAGLESGLARAAASLVVDPGQAPFLGAQGVLGRAGRVLGAADAGDRAQAAERALSATGAATTPEAVVSAAEAPTSMLVTPAGRIIQPTAETGTAARAGLDALGASVSDRVTPEVASAVLAQNTGAVRGFAAEGGVGLELAQAPTRQQWNAIADLARQTGSPAFDIVASDGTVHSGPNIGQLRRTAEQLLSEQDAGRLLVALGPDTARETIRGALDTVSGAQGGQIAVGYAADLAGAAAGGVAGYQSSPQGAGPLEVGARTAGGALLGGALAHAAPTAVGYVRRYVAPAVDAPERVQALLNAYDGQVRVSAAEADTLARQATLTQHGANVYRTGGAWAAERDFFDGLRQLGHGDGVLQAGAGAARPQGWVNGAALPARTGLQGFYVSPEVARVVRNVFDTPGQLTQLLAAPMRAVGAVKETVLSGSPFHAVFEELQAGRVLAGAGANPFPVMGAAAQNWWAPSYNAWRVRWAPVYEAAARSGVTLPEARGFHEEAGGLLTGARGVAVRSGIGFAGGAATTYGADKAGGADDRTALTDALQKGALGAAFGGIVGSVIGPALWERQVPTLKVMGWNALTGRGMAPEAAARMVNQTFGGLNLVRIARSPDVQAMARTLVFAPDVWEGMVRQLGYAMSPDLRSQVGNASKAYVAASAISGAVALEGLNKLFTGHFTNENDAGHELDLDITRFAKQTSDTGQPQRVYVDVLGLLRPVAQVGLGLARGSTDELGKFVEGRLSQPVRLGLALKTNQDYRGRPIMDPKANPAQRLTQAAGYVASQEMPAGAQSLAQSYERGGVTGAGVEATTGMRVSSVSGRPASPSASPSANPRRSIGQTLGDVGLTYPSTPSSVLVPGSGRARITLTPDERKSYATRLNANLQQQIETTLDDPSYKTASPADRRATMQAAVRTAEQDAQGTILEAISNKDLEQRLQQRAQATPTPVRPRR